MTTATKALQEQLCDEDLPFLQRASGLEFTFALLKGRSNYLCPSKLDDLASGAEPQSLLALTEREKSRGDALARVTEWAEQTDTGDRAELAVDVPDDIWQTVSISARECPGVGNCHAGERCFAERARARARAADIVVVNTSLYAAHLASGRQVLPEHDAVIVDEAHLVEDIVADAFSADVHGGRFRRLATEVQGICGRSQAVDALRLQADRIDTMVTELAADAAPRVPTYEGSVAETLMASAVRLSTQPGCCASTRSNPGRLRHRAKHARARPRRRSTPISVRCSIRRSQKRTSRSSSVNTTATRCCARRSTSTRSLPAPCSRTRRSSRRRPRWPSAAGSTTRPAASASRPSRNRSGPDCESTARSTSRPKRSSMCPSTCRNRTILRTATRWRRSCTSSSRPRADARSPCSRRGRRSARRQIDARRWADTTCCARVTRRAANSSTG